MTKGWVYLKVIATLLISVVALCCVTVSSSAESSQAPVSWCFTKEMPSAWGIPCIVPMEGRVYVLGKPSQPGGRMDIYDATTEVWSQGESIPFDASWYGGVAVDGKIVAIISDESKTLRAVEYNPATNLWTKKSPSPNYRIDPAVCEISGKLYVFGGFVERPGQMPKNTRYSEVYDFATDQWSSLADMPTARHASGTAVVNGKVYVLGGVNNTFSRPPSKVVEVYDPVANTWTKASPMPVGLAYHTVATLGSRLYLIGGMHDGRAVLAYDTIGDVWTKLEPSPLNYDFHKGIAIGDRIILFGGVEGEWPNTKNKRTVAIFKP